MYVGYHHGDVFVLFVVGVVPGVKVVGMSFFYCIDIPVVVVFVFKLVL